MINRILVAIPGIAVILAAVQNVAEKQMLIARFKGLGCRL